MWDNWASGTEQKANQLKILVTLYTLSYFFFNFYLLSHNPQMKLITVSLPSVSKFSIPPLDTHY